MTMTTNRMTLRVAALAVLAAMLFGMAAPRADAASKKKNETQTYTATYKNFDDYDVTETVTYQIGGKTVTVKEVTVIPTSDKTQTEERFYTYTLSKALKALERPDDWTAVLDVPAGTKITRSDVKRVLVNGKVVEEYRHEADDTYIEWYEADRVFSREEINRGVPIEEKADWTYDYAITVKKGKTYQMYESWMDGDEFCPGNFVFRGV